MKIGASRVTDQHQYQHGAERDLVDMVRQGQEAEHSIAAGHDGYCDGQNVIHQQGAAGDHSGLLPQGMGGHDVASAAMGKVLYDPGIGVGDDEYGQSSSQGDEHQ
jgi:hypothetical protein